MRCFCWVDGHAADRVDGGFRCHEWFKLLFHDTSYKPSHHGKVKS
jgi:hypothetical protein